jgi:hypothetical protein
VNNSDIAAELARLEQILTALRVGAIGPDIDPTPGGNELAVGFHFTFATSSTIVLGAILAGTTLRDAAVLIETPFNDPAASLQLGTSSDHTLLLGSSDSKLSLAGSYTTEAFVVVGAPDVLLLNLSLGVSTVGEGYVFFRQLPPA